MRVTGRAAAERLKTALVAGRQAAADAALAVDDVVVVYDVAIDDDLIDELLVTSREQHARYLYSCNSIHREIQTRLGEVRGHSV